MNRIEWDIITSGDYECTDRLRVPCGWLYRTTLYKQSDVGQHEHTLVAMAFVPLAEWERRPETGKVSSAEHQVTHTGAGYPTVVKY